MSKPSKTLTGAKPANQERPGHFYYWTDVPSNFYALMAEWIEDRTHEDELKRALRFAANKQIKVSGQIPGDLAAFCHRHGTVSDELKHYPTMGSILRFLAGCPVVPCKKDEAHFAVAVAGEPGGGCGKGDLIIFDTRAEVVTPEEWQGVLIWYRAVPS